MAEPFMAELRLFSFNFAPKGWAMCNGQLLSIAQNQALFSLLGTTYGGNGSTTFALPEMRGRIPLHMGEGLVLGESLGEESHTLLISEMPEHLHILNASGADGDSPLVTDTLLGAFNNGYRQPDQLTTLLPSTVSNAGGSQPHENRQPFTALNWCIALQGIFPSQN
jgi:microcystin-dependent protein